MLKCIAIDDEPLALRQIEAYISRLSSILTLERSFSSAVDAKIFLESNSVDLIFVDINMPDMSGVEFIRELSSPPMVIFTTAYSEYAVEGFRLDAVDYLLKPFSFAEFSRAATKANELNELRSVRSGDIHEGQLDYISVKADYKISRVRVSDIIYVESEGEYVRLNMVGGASLTTFCRLKNMEVTLPQSCFIRIHRSYIVNIGAIQSYAKGKVCIGNDTYLPIGDNYKEAFAERMESRSTAVLL
ncbi:MAG: LytTR family DNA-binding domain-containing protein [Rikenellaceae bacterium]